METKKEINKSTVDSVIEYFDEFHKEFKKYGVVKGVSDIAKRLRVSQAYLSIAKDLGYVSRICNNKWRPNFEKFTEEMAVEIITVNQYRANEYLRKKTEKKESQEISEETTTEQVIIPDPVQITIGFDNKVESPEPSGNKLPGRVWKYKKVEWQNHVVEVYGTDEKMLSDLGNVGWELVTIIELMGVKSFYFKKEVAA